MDLKPHKSRYWLNPKIENQQEFRKSVEEICSLYQAAPSLAEDNVHVVSCDEMTGIQALERVAETKGPKPGMVEKREFEYRRHGTLSLIASFEVTTGRILANSIGPTRNELDFVAHVEKTVKTDPSAGWIFVCDNLNTHKSESLVKWVNQNIEIPLDDSALGKKYRAGILKNMKSRSKFLEDRSHRIRFVYTPKHCSWLNQIEIWFSILQTKAIRRASFMSTDDLKSKILDFIAYYGRTMARPFRWTYSNRILNS